MKKLTLLTLVALIFSSTTLFAQQFPNVAVKDQAGKVVRTAELVDGKPPFIVTFWSMTCKPCIKELDAIYNNIEDWKDEADFRVVAVSTDDARSLSRARSLASSRGWAEAYTMIYDDNQDFKRALNTNATPQVFIFDKNGKQVYSHTGYVPGAEEEYFEKVLDLQ